MSNYSVLFLQLPHPSFPERNIPLSSAFLISAVQSNESLKGKIRLEIFDAAIMNFGGDKNIIEGIVSRKPDMIGVSLYLWNQKRTIYIIDEIKKRLPECLIMAGGPEVYPNSKLISPESPIDIFTFGEGEIIFTKILESFILSNSNLNEIPNIAVKKNGKIKFGSSKEALYDAGKLKLPYHKKIIDIIKYDSQSVFLYTMRGCPFACAYCSWSGTGKLRAFNRSEVFKEIDYIHEKAKSAEQNIKVFIMDSAFNLSPIFREVCLHIEEINFDRKLEFGCFVEAEFIDAAQANLLARANFTYVETGFQSKSNDVLKNVNRRLNPQKYERGIKALMNERLFVLGDIIVGLPEDTKDNIVSGIKYLQALGIEVNIFAFSIGDRPGIVEVCRKHELIKQVDPPYYIEHSGSLTRNEIISIHEEYKEHIVDFDFNARIYFDYPQDQQECLFENIETFNRPGVNRIIDQLVFDCSLINKYQRSAQDKIKILTGSIGSVVTVLIKGEFVFENLGNIKSILMSAAALNPFTRFVILFETEIMQNQYSEVKGLTEMSNYIFSNFYYNKNQLFPDNLKRMITQDFGVYQILPFNENEISVNGEITKIYKITINNEQQLRDFVRLLEISIGMQFLIDDPTKLINSQFDLFCRLTEKAILENNLFFIDDILKNRWKMIRGVPTRIN